MQKEAFCGLENAFQAGLLPDPNGKAQDAPQPSSQLEREHPSPYHNALILPMLACAFIWWGSAPKYLSRTKYSFLFLAIRDFYGSHRSNSRIIIRCSITKTFACRVQQLVAVLPILQARVRQQLMHTTVVAP